MAETNGNLKVAVPTFIPLADAVRKYDLTEEVLTRLIQDGRIEAAQLPSGELLVSDDGLNHAQTKEQIIEEKFRHLKGKPIRLREAARKYRLKVPTVGRWVQIGYIKRLRDEPHCVELDESDVAYCANVYHHRKREGSVAGSKIFDEKGNPYQLKYPDLASERRKENDPR
jgi:hypothetical protein